MTDELIDIYDENNRPLGIAKRKSEAHRDGSWHNGSHVWIYNSKGEALLQLRSKGKTVHPGTWDTSSSGHFVRGENAIRAAIREVKEELGLVLSESDLGAPLVLKSPKSHDGIVDNEFCNVFFIERDISIDDMSLDTEEVETVRFVPIDDLEREFAESPERFCASDSEYWLTSIVELKKRVHLGSKL